MKRRISRLATLAVALPLTTAALAGPAHAQSYSVTVPGCYGAGPDYAIVCNLTLTTSVPDARFTVLYVKACVGTCHDIPVTWVTLEGTANVCYSYTDGGGRPVGNCSQTVLAALDPNVVDVKPLDEWLACSDEQTAACTYE